MRINLVHCRRMLQNNLHVEIGHGFFFIQQKQYKCIQNTGESVCVLYTASLSHFRTILRIWTKHRLSDRQSI